jgi:hypothetical protein
MTEEPGRLRVAAHNLGEPMAVRPRVFRGNTPSLTFRAKKDGQEYPSCIREARLFRLEERAIISR